MLRNRILMTMCLFMLGLVISCDGNVSSKNNPASPTPGNASSENKKSPEPIPTTTKSEDNKPIRINAPADNEQVGERPFVEGTISDSTAKVWVIVHPTEVSDYSVQPIASIKDGGKWKVQVYIGRPGDADKDKHFEIMAVANPKKDLKEGDKLTGWPEAQSKSQIIEVTRK